MNDEHVNAAVIIWFLLWLVKHSSSSSLRRPAGLCWRRSSALSSTSCRRLRHRCRSSDWSNLLYEIWKRDLKKGQREVMCASLLLSPRLHFLSNSLTADMKRPADDEDAQLTGRYSALHPSCRHFLLHLHTDTHLQTVWCQTWTLQFSRLNQFLPSAADGSWKSDSTCRFVQTADDEEGWRSSTRDAHTCWRPCLSLNKK